MKVVSKRYCLPWSGLVNSWTPLWWESRVLLDWASCRAERPWLECLELQHSFRFHDHACASSWHDQSSELKRLCSPQFEPKRPLLVYDEHTHSISDHVTCGNWTELPADIATLPIPSFGSDFYSRENTPQSVLVKWWGLLLVERSHML